MTFEPLARASPGCRGTPGPSQRVVQCVVQRKRGHYRMGFVLACFGGPFALLAQFRCLRGRSPGTNTRASCFVLFFFAGGGWVELPRGTDQRLIRRGWPAAAAGYTTGARAVVPVRPRTVRGQGGERLALSRCGAEAPQEAARFAPG